MKNEKLMVIGKPRKVVSVGRHPVQELEKNSLSDDLILKAYNDAILAGRNYALKALICGQLLNEKRAELAPFFQNEKKGQFLNKMNEQSFCKWLDENFPEKGRVTLYRWMKAAERVMKSQLHIGAKEHPPTVIDVEGKALPISRALLAPSRELPAVAQSLRENVCAFMENKTIGEAMTVKLDGEEKRRRVIRIRTAVPENAPGANLPNVSAPVAIESSAQLLPTVVSTRLKEIGQLTAIGGTMMPVPGHEFDMEKHLEMAALFEEAMERWPFWLLRAMVLATSRCVRVKAEEERCKARVA